MPKSGETYYDNCGHIIRIQWSTDENRKKVFLWLRDFPCPGAVAEHHIPECAQNACLSTASHSKVDWTFVVYPRKCASLLGKFSWLRIVGRQFRCVFVWVTSIQNCAHGAEPTDIEFSLFMHDGCPLRTPLAIEKKRLARPLLVLW